MINLSDQFVRETKTEVTFKLKGAPFIPACAAGSFAITPVRVQVVTFSGTKDKPDSARSFVEAVGPNPNGSVMGHRSMKWNISGTSAPDISLAPQWIRLLVGA